MGALHRCILFSVLIILFGCNRAERNELERQALQKTSSEVEVEITKPELKILKKIITSSVQLQPTKSVVLYADETGVVSLINGSNGSQIELGNTIIEFSKVRLQLQLKRCSINLEKATLEFKDELIGYNASNRQLSDSLFRNFRLSSGVETAELDLKESLLKYSNATIKAPFNGRLGNMNIQIGSRVTEGDVLAVIYSDDDFYAAAKVLQTDLEHLTIGANATVEVLANHGQIYQGRLVEINPMIDGSGMLDIKVKISNPAKLYPGMIGEMEILCTNKRSMVVPKNAIVIHDGKPVIFIEENGVAKWKYVKVGSESDIEIEIVEGLDLNDNVIVNNNLQLAHDTPVKKR